MRRSVRQRKTDSLSLMFPYSLDLIRVQVPEYTSPLEEEEPTEEAIVQNWPCSVQSLTDGDVKAIGGSVLKDEFLILCPCIDGLDTYNAVSNDVETVSDGSDDDDDTDPMGDDYDPMADDDPMSDDPMNDDPMNDDPMSDEPSSPSSNTFRRYYKLVVHINGNNYTIQEQGVFGIEFIENQYVFDLQGFKIGCKIRVKANTNLLM